MEQQQGHERGAEVGDELQRVGNADPGGGQDDRGGGPILPRRGAASRRRRAGGAARIRGAGAADAAGAVRTVQGNLPLELQDAQGREGGVQPDPRRVVSVPGTACARGYLAAGMGSEERAPRVW